MFKILGEDSSETQIFNKVLRFKVEFLEGSGNGGGWGGVSTRQTVF